MGAKRLRLCQGRWIVGDQRADRGLCGFQRQRCVACDRAREFVCDGIDIVLVGDGVERAEFIRAGHRNPARGEQDFRRERAINPQHALDAARIVTEAQPAGWHCEEGILRRDAKITACGERSAGTHAGPLDQGNGRLRNRLDRLTGIFDKIVIAVGVAGTGAGLVEARDIGTGRKDQVSIAADHDHPNVVARAGGLREVADLLPHRSRNRVSSFRIAQAKRREPIIDRDCDIAGHAGALRLWRDATSRCRFRLPKTGPQARH